MIILFALISLTARASSHKVDSVFMNNITRMEVFLNGGHSTVIRCKDEMSFAMFCTFFSYLSDYEIVWLQSYTSQTFYLFSIDLEYVKCWYNKYGRRVQDEMVEEIYSYLNSPPLWDLTFEEEVNLDRDFMKKVDLYKKEIYGFDLIQ